MNAITEFLLARIDEDEADLKEPTNADYCDDLSGRHYTNERIRSDCAAKRAIIGSRQSCAAMTAKEQEPGVKLVGTGMVQGLDVALKSLAAVYSDHPDYQQKWSF